jgi:hypothetical protein
VVASFKHLVPHHPVCGASERGLFLDAAATPPRRGGEKFLKYGYNGATQNEENASVNQRAQAIVFAVVSLGLAAAGWIFGMSLLPSRAVAQEEGTTIPWVIIWSMIWITTLSAVALAGFLLAGKRNSE